MKITRNTMNIQQSVLNLKFIFESFIANISSNIIDNEAIVFILEIIIRLIPLATLIIFIIYYKQSEVFRKGAGLHLIIALVCISIALEEWFLPGWQFMIQFSI